MYDRKLARKAGENLESLRERKPLIHNITNFVVMNSTANVLLACGASPVMAHAAEEVEEMVSLAGALVLNIGTLAPDWIASMLKAGKRANEIGIPIILDPVGSGATRLRTESAQLLLKKLTVSVVRGNASEVLSLAKEGSRTKGVDSRHGVEEAAGAAVSLSQELDTVLAITGAVDLITDGKTICRVFNGHELMGYVTGTGCAATVIIGAFLAVDPSPLTAAVTGLAYFGLAGEKAAERASSPGQFQVGLYDALYTITPDELARGARIKVQKIGDKAQIS